MLEQFLVLQWNGLKWTANNTHHALVPCGPYSSRESAQANIDKYLAQAEVDEAKLTGEQDARAYVDLIRREVCIVPVMWPMDPPADFEGVPQFGT